MTPGEVVTLVRNLEEVILAMTEEATRHPSGMEMVVTVPAGGGDFIDVVVDLERLVPIEARWTENGENKKTPIPRMDVVWRKPVDHERDSSTVPGPDGGSSGGDLG